MRVDDHGTAEVHILDGTVKTIRIRACIIRDCLKDPHISLLLRNLLKP